MGNVCSISMPCDAVATRCWDDCIRGRAMYICNLEENMVALKKAMQQLEAKREDVVTKVNLAEQQQLKRLREVQSWLSSVADAEIKVAELIRDADQEIERFCLGGCCSKNCKSTYKFGKRVAQNLKDVDALKSDGDFKEVAERVPIDPKDVIPSEPTIGLNSTFDKVCCCLHDEKVRIIGLYGTGGVGKTILLKQINNSCRDPLYNFDVLIWVVVSAAMKLEKIQEDIGKKIGFSDNNWKDKSLDEKAINISRVLSSKKFVLFLDDIWERVDLTKVGVPFSCQNNGSKIVFTTRSFEVCGQMEADAKIKVESLAPEEALELFCKKVGEDTLASHPRIPQLAKIVAKECDGLPLTLITVGRAMACKKTLEEWEYAVTVLRRDASKFSGMGREVYPRLKFSYDNLSNETIRSCFLYCSLFPEDFLIHKTDLIEYWSCEGFLGESDDRSEIRNVGYDIIGTLVNACLLEEENDRVKMHDVTRDVALWIACEYENGKQNFLVRAGAQLTEVPKVEGWKRAERVSLMANYIENVTEPPTCLGLLTLFLHDNRLKMIASEFFQFMPSLQVLDLSCNEELTELPLGISKLVSLEYLNLSETGIRQLPIELKSLVKLKYLNLEWMSELTQIPCQLISSFSMLQVLRMLYCGFVSYPMEESTGILSGGNELLVEELQCLKYLNMLTIDIKSDSALQRFLSFQKLNSCAEALRLCDLIGSEQLNVLSLTNVKRLENLIIDGCDSFQELKIDSASKGREIEASSVILSERCFDSLRDVRIYSCSKLGDLTWLIFAPTLTSLTVVQCYELEEIISARKLGEDPEVVGNLNLFAKLEFLHLQSLPELKSIHRSSLPFPDLNKITIHGCPKLKKFPLSSNSAKECKIIIDGTERQWEELEREEETTQKASLPF